MSEPAHELARREQGDALSTILGTGDTRSALAQVERNVRDIIAVCRDRGFITHYVNENRKTGEVRESDFYGFPAWQLLGLTYGVSPIVEWVKAIDGGFQARAVAQTRDGGIVGAAEALCLRKEPGKQYKSDHDLAAMAQSRAQRNALRGALGAALVLAGFDFPDPEAPATKAQKGLLHQLERELGLTHEQGHVEAGVDSYSDLTREQAAEVIDRWQRAEQESAGVAGESSGEDRSPAESPAEVGEGGSRGDAPSPPESAPAGDTIVDGPATDEQWKRAIKAGLTANKAILRARERWPEAKTTSASAITRNQLAALIEEALG